MDLVTNSFVKNVTAQDVSYEIQFLGIFYTDKLF
jgi:hypothetical protein